MSDGHLPPSPGILVQSCTTAVTRNNELRNSCSRFFFAGRVPSIDAAAHVQGFEGPRQNGLHPRDVFSRHRIRAPPGPFGLFNYTGTHGDPPPAGCGCGLYLAPLPRFFQQGWLAQPSPTALSPFDPTSYSL